MPSNGPPKTEPRSPEALRAEIERTRAELSTSVTALREEVAAAVDWREWVRTHPMAAVGAAFTLGFLLGQRR
ncbi:Protein of unknown function [Stigmatella aurantiaca]|jgi:ElaB/YqjD/DUF883 family membrane-anchored ribosome-binding protein|uniref:DUF3618 domain-containing protein n=1 Tax=Stigmatella aurantiaca TaxID=41 RepID=A0A1H7UU36_STIAU|nr:DUF3618 domain-containing protein [Stigmatella aurantiaca]SEM00259.1 Protein of unknown function [Stigmatella aurantiaca]